MSLLRLPRFLFKKPDSNKSKLQLVRSQTSFHFSLRVRRALKTYNFYKNLWQEKALHEFLRSLRNNILNQRLLLSAIGLFTFNWDDERISLDESVKDFFDEFDRIKSLKSLANLSDKPQPDCEKSKHTVDYHKNDINSWEFYVRKDNLITWRREEEDGHYAYKVYVQYKDISAQDFLFVQTDVDYRREWDDTAVQLDIVESNTQENSQVMYWEMMWPKLFSNRDYVFIRKHFIDKQRNLILIVNRSTKHPNCPIKPGLQRVKEYWSFMVIKPSTTFEQPGLEFILTYYDNPGIRIPKYVTSWVAQRQLPDFIEKLHLATLKHAERKTSIWGKNTDPGFEYPSDVRLDEFEVTDEMQDNVNKMKNDETQNAEDESDDEIDTLTKSKSWWSYFVPYNYLH